MDAFRVRLNCIDHYQATPTIYDPQLRKDVQVSKKKEPQVPVIRVFGSTETGQKVCAHIHGAFPYLFVEYEGSLKRDEVGSYMYRLHLSIDHALAVSYRRDAYKEEPKFVARVTLVKGIPFYGFHVGYRFYLKIYMLSPVVMTRLADLLQQGLIMNRRFQPYEAHLQYLLQFMTDYNLYGCDYIEAGKVAFRAPVPMPEDSPHLWHSQSIPPDKIVDDFSLPRVSHCSIEVDIHVEDILNRKAIQERPLHHNFVERVKPIPEGIKLVHSMAGLWKDETKRRKRRMGISDPKSSPFPPDVLVPMSADPRDSQPPGWLHEEEYREQIKELIEQDAKAADMKKPSFGDFVKSPPFEDSVRTVLQSVEDLYPENLLPALGLDENPARDGINPTSSIEVDEKGIRKFREDNDEDDDDDLFPDDSDEEILREAANIDQTISDDKLLKSVNGLSGVCLSGLRNRKTPHIPVTKELIAAAREEGLVSKSRSARNPVTVNGLKKRSPSPSEVAVQALKRPRRIQEIIPESQTTPSLPRATPDTHLANGGSGHGNPLPVASQPSQSSQSRKLTVNGNSSQTQGNQLLNFRVVKDPNDPNTKLRLSQLSGSQRDDGVKKHVTFDDNLPTLKDCSLESASAQQSHPNSSFLTIEGEPPSPTRSRPLKLRWHSTTKMFALNIAPPTSLEVIGTMQEHGLPDAIYQDAFYSNEKDVPPRMREYAGREFRLEGNTLPYLPDFDATGQSPATFGEKMAICPDRESTEISEEKRRKECSWRSWEFAQPPPTFKEVGEWWAAKQEDPRTKSVSPKKRLPDTPGRKPYLSQIVGATPRNKHGFKYSQKQKSTSVKHEAQYMSTMSLEIHVNTRGTLYPNPEEDEVQCIFWCLKSDEHLAKTSSQAQGGTLAGMIVLSEDGSLVERIRRQTPATVEVLEESSELDVMVRMVEIVRNHDPDILTGYEVHGSSWGYLIERARFKYDYNLCDEFSRMKSHSHGRFGKEADRWGFNTTSTIYVTGRHMINVWRAMRGELNLLQYTMENVVWHLLHRRIPHYSWQTLTNWYGNGRHRDLAKILRYYLTRTRLDLEILDANELLARTSEQARLLGVDFFSVFSRGSQFKVESIMFRIAKPENLMLVSPSRKQVGGQNALECLPLVMEPQSAFYNSPLVVLDFQSLYPSVMIAYNYCYSTFLGRIVNWRGTNKMGFAEYERQQGLLQLLKDHINIAPNGIMYAKPEIRKSLLAKMLIEILETRVMVKSGMKQDKDDKTLQQLLNNRQLALKLLANVTYGYTSASFSGRMPCSEIADSIVQTGRETLERAIAYIHSVEKWGAEVVYGDTDSLFVYLKGRTREQAFEIGNEMAKAITDMNPRPVKLKFEKVYHPCVLLAKKRYVGYKYESRDQTVPEFDAKGIETVRRDGTPAEQKIEEKALKLLFDTADLSQVKAYFQAECAKILRGALSVQDFCFAREVKLGSYSTATGAPPPPGAVISTRRMLADARAEPQYGERVPYVVVTGAPGARLVDRCVAPEELLASPHCELDAGYYISKNIIPPLERIFNLVGANVRAWYDEMPKVQRIRRVEGGGGGADGPVNAAGAGGNTRKATLESYLRSASCVVCGVKMKTATAAGADGEVAVCRACQRDAPGSMVRLQNRLGAEQRRFADTVSVCQSCAGMAPGEGEVPCDSKDCPVFYTRVKQGARLRSERAVVEPVLRRLMGDGVGREMLEW